MERLWLFLAVCLGIYAVSISGKCQIPKEKFLVLNETDPPGTAIVSLPIDDGVWGYKLIPKWLEDYIKSTNTSARHDIVIKKIFDLEEMIVEHKNLEDMVGTLTLQCTEPKKVTVKKDIFIIIQQKNEFAPQFSDTNITIKMKETNKIGTPVVDLSDYVSDKDVNFLTREISSYNFVDKTLYDQFYLKASTGKMSTSKELDYESLPPQRKYFTAEVLVKDAGGKSVLGKVTIIVSNIDDTPPVFRKKSCTSNCLSNNFIAEIHPGFKGKIDKMKPFKMMAVDGDGLNAKISYSIDKGPEGYTCCITIHPDTGEVTIAKPLTNLTRRKSSWNFIIKAVELTPTGLFTIVHLAIYEERSTLFITESSASLLAMGLAMGSVILLLLGVLFLVLNYYKKRKACRDPDQGEDVPVETDENEEKSEEKEEEEEEDQSMVDESSVDWPESSVKINLEIEDDLSSYVG